MATFFVFLYNLSKKYRVVFLSLVAGVFLLSVYLATHLELEEDITQVIPQDKNIEQLNAVLQSPKFRDRLVVNVFQTDSNAAANPQLLTSYADDFVTALQSEFDSNYIKEITYRVSDEKREKVYDVFYENLPLFLDKADYEKIDSLITEQGVEKALQADYKNLISPAGFALKKFITKDPLSITPLALNKLQSLQFDDNYDLQDGYIFTKDRKNILLFITPSNPSNETFKNSKLLEGIRKNFTALNEKSGQQVNAIYFGGMAVAVSNAGRLKKDIPVTSAIAVMLLTLVISLYFRKGAVIFLILLPSIFGAVVSLAILFLIKVKVSAIALGVGSIILGITVNYALHLFAHFKSVDSVEQVIRDIATPLFTTCLTTAAAFLCLLTLKSGALHDFGLFAAFSVVSSVLFCLTVLPHFLKENAAHAKPQIIDKLSAYSWESNKFVLIAVAGVCLVCLFFFGKVDFEDDLTNMSYVTNDLKQAESRLNRLSQYSLRSMYLVSSGKNLDEALENNEKNLEKVEEMKKEGIVQKFTNVSLILISEKRQAEKINEWKTFWTTEKKERLRENLIENGKTLKFSESAFSGFTGLLDKEFKPQSPETFRELKELFLSDFITEKEKSTSIITLLKVESENKSKVYASFSSNDKLFVFDKQYLTARFVEILKSDFNKLAFLSLSLVLIIIILSFGRIELGLITFVPMALSWLMTLGIMGALHVKFNMFNMIISTFIFGLGDDYSLFLTQGMLLEYKLGHKNLSSYKSSILLSTITTMTGIGVLIFAKHPALQSIALVSIIGIFSVLVITFTVQPLLFNWLILNRKYKHRYPVTLRVLLKTIVTWGLIVINCIWLIIAGALIFSIAPINRKKRKLLFHWLFMQASKYFIKMTFPFNYKLINNSGQDFKKPAVIICNHQSLIENPLLVMLYPKLIILTNDWIFKSPHFGPIARFADFYPVSSGIDTVMSDLRDRVAEGYSLIVFPEGHRSEDGKIQRFHKGAFYLAEQLQLDILPILFHGTGDFLRKGAIWGRSNPVAVKIFDRIRLDDLRFGKTYAERTKAIKKFMAEEYEKLRHEIETPAYFRDHLVSNYIFKGPILEWYMKVKLSLENNYERYHQLLPKKGEILDIGCGYGFLSYMLHFLSNDRNITGVDYDSEKIEVAQNCFSKDKKINFESSDIMQYEFGKKDAFVLSDVLHYLPLAQQKLLLQKCVENLNEGGVILIRDANTEIKEKHFATQLTEFFSTNFGFNKTNHQLSFVSEKDIRENISQFNLNVKVVEQSKMTSNMMMVIEKPQRKNILADGKV